jgi:hypothetical protein
MGRAAVVGAVRPPLLRHLEYLALRPWRKWRAKAASDLEISLGGPSRSNSKSERQPRSGAPVEGQERKAPPNTPYDSPERGYAHRANWRSKPMGTTWNVSLWHIPDLRSTTALVTEADARHWRRSRSAE